MLLSPEMNARHDDETLMVPGETVSLKCEITGAVHTEVIAYFLRRLADQITRGHAGAAASTPSGLKLRWVVKRRPIRPLQNDKPISDQISAKQITS